jgi:Ca2+-binding EF-hand superfamily protein
MGEALTASEAEEFMREADLNGDGKLDYDEFARILSCGDADDQ